MFDNFIQTYYYEIIKIGASFVVLGLIIGITKFLLNFWQKIKI